MRKIAGLLHKEKGRSLMHLLAQKAKLAYLASLHSVYVTLFYINQEFSNHKVLNKMTIRNWSSKNNDGEVVKELTVA